MTSKAEWKKQYENFTPAERRRRLNELGAVPEKDDEQMREHEALAALVAQDDEKVFMEQAEHENRMMREGEDIE